jgi:hypothetical protein
MKQEGNEKGLLGCIDQTTSSKLYGLIMNISREQSHDKGTSMQPSG